MIKSNGIRFQGFILKKKLENYVTSNPKIEEVLKKLGINYMLYMRAHNFKNNIGIVNLNPTEGTQ